MNCSVCQKEMLFIEKYFTYREDGKEYLREIYQCEKDDVWVTVETPTGVKKKLA